MAKKGRPSIFETLNMKDFENFLKSVDPGKSQRFYENELYEAEGLNLTQKILSESDSKIPYIEKIYDFDEEKERPVYIAFGIMTEIGRMSLQNHYGIEPIKQILTIAAQMLHDDHSIKEVSKYIREVRQTGEIPPKLEKVVKTVEITESEQRILQISLYNAIGDLLHSPDVNFDADVLPLVSFYEKIENPEFTSLMKVLNSLPEE